MRESNVKGAAYIALGVGELAIAKSPSVMSTVLGSCVAVCIYSIRGKGGGMNHFALPVSTDGKGSDLHNSAPYRYGDHSMKQLIDKVLAIPGVERRDLRAKVIGGACIMGSGVTNASIGIENTKIALEILQHHGIPVVAQDTGGATGRKLFFYTDSGRVRVSVVDNLRRTLETARRNPTSPLMQTKAPVITAVASRKKRVLIVDDSKTIQEILKNIFKDDPDLEVAGVAANPIEAEKIISATQVDVITLDIHMPIMDGVTFLAKQMQSKPIPTIMISALSMEDGDQVLKALEIGAVDYIQKPKMTDMAQVAPLIREKVKAAAVAKIRRRLFSRSASKRKSDASDRGKILIAIGASTGGTEALKEVLTSLPAKIPPIVIVQHIPATFSRAFANRLNDLCPFEVKEAADGDKLQAGRVLVAPGGLQMSIEPDGTSYKVKVADTAPVNRHKPSVDVLFESVARHAAGNAMGVILTGMGNDGAKGMLDMKRAGCFSVAQDEKTCVVFGMPKEAIRMGGVEEVCPLEAVAKKIEDWMQRRKFSKAS